MNAETQKPLQEAESIPKETTFTLRGSPYTYLHLSLKNITIDRVALDDITARTYLTSALSQYLGLTGSAIPIDILKVADQDLWIRVPEQDASAVVAAVGQWANVPLGITLKIEGRGEWLGGVVAGVETRRDKLFSLDR